MTILGTAHYAIAPGWDVSVAATSWYILDGDISQHWYQPEPELNPLPPLAYTGEGDPIYQADELGRIVHSGRLAWPEPGLPNDVLNTLLGSYPVGGKACIAMLAWGYTPAAGQHVFSYARWNCKIKRPSGLERVPFWQGYKAQIEIDWAVKI